MILAPDPEPFSPETYRDPLNLSASDVARLTGLSPSTIRRLADANRIRHLRVTVLGEKVCRVFRRSWVDEFIRANTRGPETN